MLKTKLIVIQHYVRLSVKWCLFSILTGIVCGLLGTGLYFFVQWANEIRGEYNWLLIFLPIAGLIVVKTYHMFDIHEDKGTDLIFDSVRNAQDIPFKITVVSFLSTVFTHLFGGSAGRVGVAIQMGGSISSNLSRIFKLNPKDRSLFVMCGMAGLISALFGTPLMAAFLSMEVISIGVIYYAALLPCLLTSLTSYFVAEALNIVPMRYTIEQVPALSVDSVTKIIFLGAACAVVSILFCGVMKLWGDTMKKKVENQYIRILIGSGIIIILTLLSGSQVYNGSSASLLNQAIIYGQAHPYDFLLKIVFTAITLQSGYKGGAVFPALVIGATFGCTFGWWLGLPVEFAAAVGMVAVFCGSVNCPIASIFLSVEVFGGAGIVLFAIACAISFVFSGYFTVFPGQQFIYSKLRIEYKHSTMRNVEEDDFD